jgi:hypothetical protein
LKPGHERIPIATRNFHAIGARVGVMVGIATNVFNG